MLERCVSETTPHLKVDSPISFTVVIIYFVVISLASWYIIQKVFKT